MGWDKGGGDGHVFFEGLLFGSLSHSLCSSSSRVYTVGRGERWGGVNVHPGWRIDEACEERERRDKQMLRLAGAAARKGGSDGTCRSICREESDDDGSEGIYSRYKHIAPGSKQREERGVYRTPIARTCSIWSRLKRWTMDHGAELRFTVFGLSSTSRAEQSRAGLVLMFTSRAAFTCGMAWI